MLAFAAAFAGQPTELPNELAALADRTLFLSRGELREASDTMSLVGGNEP